MFLLYYYYSSIITYFFYIIIYHIYHLFLWEVLVCSLQVFFQSFLLHMKQIERILIVLLKKEQREMYENIYALMNTLSSSKSDILLFSINFKRV